MWTAIGHLGCNPPPFSYVDISCGDYLHLHVCDATHCSCLSGVFAWCWHERYHRRHRWRSPLQDTQGCLEFAWDRTGLSKQTFFFFFHSHPRSVTIVLSFCVAMEEKQVIYVCGDNKVFGLKGRQEDSSFCRISWWPDISLRLVLVHDRAIFTTRLCVFFFLVVHLQCMSTFWSLKKQTFERRSQNAEIRRL